MSLSRRSLELHKRLGLCRQRPEAQPYRHEKTPCGMQGVLKGVLWISC